MTAMAATYAPDRIRVNVVAPGSDRHADGRDAPPAIRATARSRARKQPLAGELHGPGRGRRRRRSTSCPTSRASVTGQLLTVDGGWSVASRLARAVAVSRCWPRRSA